jgi:dual specificity MAP kinase phosphatase
MLITPPPEPATRSSLPTEVIPGFLFLGTFDQASSLDLLRVLGITAILNVSYIYDWSIGAKPFRFQYTFPIFVFSLHAYNKYQQITLFLQTVPSSVTHYQSSFQYHTVSSVPPPFEECAAFLDTVNERNGKALIYCMSGTSRGPTTAIFYLMARERLPLRMAYSIVKSKHPTMALNAIDRDRLIDAEKNLLGAEALGLDDVC